MFVPQQLRLERSNRKREFASFEKQKEGAKEQLPKGNLYKKEMGTTLKNISLRKQRKLDVLKKKLFQIIHEFILKTSHF